MSRPVSSDISYPFVDTDGYDELAFFKDAVLTVEGAPHSQIIIPGLPEEPSVYLSSISGNVINVRACRPLGSGNFDVWDMSFIVPSGEGFGTVVCGISALMLDFSQFPDSGLSESYAPGALVFEPCTVRWRHMAITSLTLANELRVMNPEDRINLTTSSVVVMDGASDIRLSDGYNTSILYGKGVLEFYAGPGSGKGVAPDNMWDVGTPVDNSDVLRGINGVSPDAEGDIILTSSPSLSMSLDGPNKIKIMDNNV